MTTRYDNVHDLATGLHGPEIASGLRSIRCQSTLNEWLGSLRLAHKVTREDLSSRSGLSVQELDLLECGQNSDIQADKLISFVKGLGCRLAITAEWCCGGCCSCYRSS